MRADRLLSLVLLLHAKGRMTAGDLARQLEVSERTIYRDLDALGSAGIPVYAQSGVNGGIFLDEHYRLTLTGLSKAEAQALFVSSEVGPLGDLGFGKAAEDTLLKIFAALPFAHQSEAERMRQRFHIDPANWFQIIEPPPFLPVLQQAVWEDRRVRIAYQPVEGEAQEREIDAYALVAKANIWYLVGRKPNGEMRNYRIGRFRNLILLDSHFERDPTFDLADYWKRSSETYERAAMAQIPPYEATLRVHPAALWYFPGFMEGRYQQVCAPDEEGWCRLRVTFISLDDARMRVLGLGTTVMVLEPDELRNTVLDTARAILEFHAAKGMELPPRATPDRARSAPSGYVPGSRV